MNVSRKWGLGYRTHKELIEILLEFCVLSLQLSVGERKLDVLVHLLEDLLADVHEAIEEPFNLERTDETSSHVFGVLDLGCSGVDGSLSKSRTTTVCKFLWSIVRVLGSHNGRKAARIVRVGGRKTHRGRLRVL